MIRDSFSPSASSTSLKTSLASGKASASSRPMPTAWLPWPGNVNAMVISGAPLLVVRTGKSGRGGAMLLFRQAFYHRQPLHEVESCAGIRQELSAIEALPHSKVEMSWPPSYIG